MTDAEQLRDVFHYDSDTGRFVWKKRTSNRVVVGSEAGYRKKCAGQWYRYISFQGRQQGAHRLAILYMTGQWPSHEVDHRDYDGMNNRWDNLRAATRSQNSANKGAQSNNKIGLKGVCKQTKSDRYMAWGKGIYLGTFDTPEEAHAAYVAAAEKQFGEFARPA